jgi:hypothetical protein
MGTAVPDLIKGVYTPPTEIGNLGAFFQPSTSAETKLVRSDEKLVRDLVAVIDRQLLSAIDTRSAREFESVRTRVMPRYVRALRALYDTVVNLISDETVESISESVFAVLAEDLEEQRDRFGSKLTDQAVFTLYTIQKIGALGRDMVSYGPAPRDKKKQDREYLYEYHAASLWAQFHLDMLFAATKFDRPIVDSIKPDVCNGMKAAVDAYVVMRDAFALRCPQEQDTLPVVPLPWDEEDEQLLASSMRDRNIDPSDEP